MDRSVAEAVNTVARFCGVRDVPILTHEALKAATGMPAADVMVLFGGSIRSGVHVLGRAMEEGAARYYVIVGGEGHTTATLRESVHGAYPDIRTDGLSEAEVFDALLFRLYGRHADALEKRSTNCGNNITYLLDLLRDKGLSCRSIILTQDATMQRRMDAGMRMQAPDVRIINYAAYRTEVMEDGAGLTYCEDIEGMWDVERYISLLMGEIPRLRDDEEGYGPRGKGFIGHVDIPGEVESAFAVLRREFRDGVRVADARYASGAE